MVKQSRAKQELIVEAVRQGLEGDAAVESVRTLAADLNIADHLSDFGIQEKDIPELAAGVMKVTRLLANNPRDLTQKDAEAIYRRVL